MTTKEKIKEIIDNQPDDATHEEIVRELAFSGMIERGLKDVRNERVISNEKMGKRIRLWQQKKDGGKKLPYGLKISTDILPKKTRKLRDGL